MNELQQKLAKRRQIMGESIEAESFPPSPTPSPTTSSTPPSTQAIQLTLPTTHLSSQPFLGMFSFDFRS
jgi:hypothetical protein